MISVLLWIIKLVACFIAFAFWSTIGLFIALTKISRVAIAFSMKASLQAFKAQDMKSAEADIHTALSFWPNGVKRILSILDAEGSSTEDFSLTWNQVLPTLYRDIAYALAFLMPLILYFLFKSYIQTPDWEAKLLRSNIIPGLSIGPISLGTYQRELSKLVGDGSNEMNSDSNNGEFAFFSHFSGSSLDLRITFSERRTVSSIRISNFAKEPPTGTPALKTVTLFSSQVTVEQDLGRPQKVTKYITSGCKNFSSGGEATQWKYPGMDIYFCDATNRVVMMEVYRK